MNKDLENAKERRKEGRELMAEQHSRMLEDLKFSNPSDPQQWDDGAKTYRKGRPCLTFDRTNQFIQQVVNDARMNKPSIQVIPADSKADKDTAEKLNGIVKHIEYTSRAGITYDTAMENSARCGIGWMRVLPVILNPETNEQEIRIQRVHDVFSVILDPNSVEPDGQDAMWGQVEISYTKKAFERAFPKAKVETWDSEGWFGDNIRVCEDFYIEEKKEIRIVTELGTFTEDEYIELNLLSPVPIIEKFTATIRVQKWRKLSGCEILEETVFPSKYVPLVPVYGLEVWVEDKRYICGMTRRLMDSQRAYNYERSAFIESVALQPKAPYMASAEAVEGHEDAWAKLNQGNPAYTVYNAYDDQGRAIPMPMRQQPPILPAAFAQGGQIASSDMESAIGMHKANLGQTTNETSGRAIMARQKEGDTANFHYVDNMARSIEQLGRIVVDMIPRIYDTQRQARILGDDGSNSFVQIDPKMPTASRKEGRKVVAINPGVGTYDVRVKAGPSFTSLRQESAQQLSELLQRAPDLMPILGDVWVRMQDWPEADKIAARLKAMLPPQLAALEEPEDGEDPTAQIAQKAQQMGQQIEAMEQAGMKLQDNLQKCQDDLQKMQSQLMSEQAKAQKAEIDAARANAMLDVSEAEKQALTNVHQAMGEQQNVQPEKEPQQPLILPDVNGQLANAMAPAMESIAQSSQNTEQHLASMAQDQQALATLIAQGQEQMAQLMQQMMQPRQSVIKIEKKDGGFVGTKVES